MPKVLMKTIDEGDALYSLTGCIRAKREEAHHGPFFRQLEGLNYVLRGRAEGAADGYPA